MSDDYISVRFSYAVLHLLASKGSAVNVVISCHSDQQKISEQLEKALRQQNVPCYIINESTPQSLSARSNLIRWSDVFIVLISRSYQRTYYCLETISYAKDVRKPVVSLLAESTFQPYGALGAIAASSIRSIVLGNEGISQNLLSEISNTIAGQTNKNKAGNNIVEPSQVGLNTSIESFQDEISARSSRVCKRRPSWSQVKNRPMFSSVLWTTVSRSVNSSTRILSTMGSMWLWKTFRKPTPPAALDVVRCSSLFYRRNWNRARCVEQLSKKSVDFWNQSCPW